MQPLLNGFQAISLEKTNRLAKMLNRVDNKYVVNGEQYRALLAMLRDQYGVLDIKNCNEFQYRSCYYDDNYSCYFEHHQARRKRVKVRTREYVNSGLKFFEIKLKGLRGRTDKHRTNCDQIVMPKLQSEQHAMLVELFAKKYKMAMPFDFQPALIVNYSRCTLVALKGGERVTIDFDLRFELPYRNKNAVQIGHDFIIVETKSGDGHGIVDDALKQLGVRRASKCSKYCIGVNLTGAVTKNNNFLHTIKHVRKNIVPSAPGAAIA